MKVKFYDGRDSENPNAYIGFLFEKELKKQVYLGQLLHVNGEYYKVTNWKLFNARIQMVRVDRIILCLDEPEPTENDHPVCPVCHNVAWDAVFGRYEEFSGIHYCEHCGAKLETVKTVTYNTMVRNLPHIREVQQ